MNDQTPSYNPKERNLRIDSKLLQPLGELERILNGMIAEIINKSDVNNADRAYITMREVDLREKGAPNFYTYKLTISLSCNSNNGYKGVVVSCSSVGNILSLNKITCRNLEKGESFEISGNYLSTIRNVIDDLLNTVYWENETRKELARDLGISSYEKMSLMPSSLSKIYANINLTEKQGKPTIEIFENQYCLDGGMIRYKNGRSDIDVHYRFL